ncbi:hypothetical protein CKAH01_11905 [Colletotrichum kahawae]|uniref:Uncharacterized protein n=1 Tax=Colletotrichum kahawae TaxID=34407 RepID=A0AAD9YVM6_COLKA|nr:hypothetical protein CKAH01_11905 [Colletotrichum kahawae]
MGPCLLEREPEEQQTPAARLQHSACPRTHATCNSGRWIGLRRDATSLICHHQCRCTTKALRRTAQETYSTRDETRHSNAQSKQHASPSPIPMPMQICGVGSGSTVGSGGCGGALVAARDHHPLITLSRPAFCCAAPQSPVDLGRGARPQRGQQARGQSESRETMTINMIPNRHLTSAETISCHLPASRSPFGTLCSPAISPGRLWELRREAVAGEGETMGRFPFTRACVTGCCLPSASA